MLEALGVAIELGPAGVARCVAEAGVGFCLAPRYHPAMRFLGPARKELGVPTTFNFLGPLANPARVRRQAVGVSDATMADDACSARCARSAPSTRMVFHGDDGLDELTTTTTSTVHELRRRRRCTTYTIDPLDLGIARADAAHLVGGDAATNADVHRGGARRRARAARRDIAVLNAAAALVVAGLAADLGAGVEVAAEAIDSGAPRGALDTLVRVSTDARARETEQS